MESVKDIKQSIKKLTVKSSGQIHGRVLDKLLRVLDKSKKQSADIKPNIWRIIMKSKISIPLPFAAGFLIIFCLQFVLQFTGLTSRFKVPEKIVQTKPAATTVSISEQSTKAFYSEHSVYVTGIGFVKKSKNYDLF